MIFRTSPGGICMDMLVLWRVTVSSSWLCFLIRSILRSILFRVMLRFQVGEWCLFKIIQLGKHQKKMFWEASPWWVLLFCSTGFPSSHPGGFFCISSCWWYFMCVECIFIGFSHEFPAARTVLNRQFLSLMIRGLSKCRFVGTTWTPGISTYWKHTVAFVLSKGFRGKEHLWVVRLRSLCVYACGHKSNLLAHPFKKKKRLFQEVFLLKKINVWTGKQLNCFAGTSVPSLTNMYIHIE